MMTLFNQLFFNRLALISSVHQLVIIISLIQATPAHIVKQTEKQSTQGHKQKQNRIENEQTQTNCKTGRKAVTIINRTNLLQLNLVSSSILMTSSN